MNDTSSSSTVSWVLQLSIRDGQLDNLTALMKEMVTATHEEEPGAQTYEWFLSEDGSTCHIYERYTDSQAVVAHLGNFMSKFADRFLGCLEPTAFTVYGNPSPEARTGLDTFGARYLDRSAGFRR